MADSVSVNILALGEQALVLELGGEPTAEHQARLCALADKYRDYPGILDAVPGMFNLTIQFNHQYAFKELRDALVADWQQTDGSKYIATEIDIPVDYGGEFGPDLDAVAEYCGLTPEQVVQYHSEARYQVFFLGFQPGFAYLGGLPERLVMPRHDTPRTQVPAGSVAIGGAQTGIYPGAGPGGWQLIGRTEKPLFNINEHPPVLLFPGARVRFSVHSYAGRPWPQES